jgi:riboflavin kinase / FMN adenylyltransferase
MITVYDQQPISFSFQFPVGISIGSFDGLHLGHQRLLQELRQVVTGKGTLCVFTFSNHPSSIFKPAAPTPQLCTLEHKKLLLEQAGVDLLFLQSFDTSFSQKPYDIFIKELINRLPFQFLFQGEGTTFGKDRQGNEATVHALGNELGFTVRYIKKLELDGYKVSSSLIRTCVSEGNLSLASKLLGRPYSIYTQQYRYGPEASLCFISATGLVLPPENEYDVRCKRENNVFIGRAKIDRKKSLIEVRIHSSSFFSSSNRVPLELEF